MQRKIYIFVPINIGRNLQSLLKRKAPGVEFITPSSPNEELKYFSEIFESPKKEEIPELIVTLQPEILKYCKREEIKQHFVDIGNQFPNIRKELEEKQLQSTQSFIKPLFYTPIILIINKDAKAKPASWSDLSHPQFKGKILAPDAKTPISMAFRQLMQEMNSQTHANDTLNSVKYSGLPFDVITGVNKGFYDIGILPLPFARYNIGKNIETFIPDEGAMVLPEMLLLRNDASEETMAVAHELFGKNIQRFFSQLGALIPVIEDIPLPAEIKHSPSFYWKGWDWFHNIIINNG